MKCTLKVITPVHIGNGLKYGPQEFYTGKGKSGKRKLDIFTRVDTTKLYSKLDEKTREKFLHNLTTPEFNLDGFFKGFPAAKKAGKESVRYKGILKTKTGQIKEVNEHIKTSDKLYIPGSSIKGSIRTAILYHHIRNSDLERISDAINRRRYSDLKSIINGFFSAESRDAAKKSVMRFLQVTDTSTVKTPYLHEMKVLNAGRGSFGYKNFPLHLEFIPRKELEFEIRSTYTGIYDDIGLGDRKKLADPETVIESLYDFSRDYIEHEIEFASKYSIDFLEKLYRKLRKINSPKTPLMRIGYGSGFLATTIALRFKEEDPSTYDSIRKLAGRRTYSYEFPKTRKLINGKIPPGWVKVIFND
ncbi:type III-A CRISPR-associated RAMP protein Csm5 [Methanothermobacter sp. KEPCO-1]|uniref:type III-A CRISPR-associated RAMP protein Csm5 n=1 Tax=Methanothermobacter sp. KEPCO-1 TaxID=2603820 RepID=UPI0011C92DE7|nr:type III-A CRISPR-associated RAMP protein Csm5 [Methanothermobacter sp. KEPCO-1]QEF94777.1 type III-A CRISPR-associated RAMP protein Csm5 [Methanothermobacter sp. KEPCO-1]